SPEDGNAVCVIGCEDCGQYHDSECPELGPLVTVQDSFVLSRARSSLPNSLEIRQVADGKEGVFVLRRLVRRTRFGPFEAKRVPHLENEGVFPLKIFQKDGVVVCFDSSSEDDCNWMMLVRPATDHKHQNLTAYQLDDDLYFNTSQDVLPGTELRVWYGAFYAKKMDKSMLKLFFSTVNEVEVSLFICSKPFQTSELLCNMLIHLDGGKTVTVYPVDPLLLQDRGPSEDEGDPTLAQLGPKRGHSRGRKAKGRRPGATAALSKNKGEDEQKQMKPSFERSQPVASAATESSSLLRPPDSGTVMKRHKAKEHKRVYCCSLCSKVFQNSSNLNRHIRSHGDKLFKCDECDKLFSRKESLKQHISYKHSKNTPDHEYKYKCNMCEKSFRLENALKFHNCRTATFLSTRRSTARSYIPVKSATRCTVWVRHTRAESCIFAELQENQHFVLCLLSVYMVFEMSQSEFQ
uniref:Uncharacterized protein n=1 Tax=Mola mola TaxID=94237 RepID=A0A3Q3W0Q4_MOLML